MADAETPARVPPALVDLGRALGRDVPASLRRARVAAAQIRLAATPTVKRPGGKK